MPKKTLEVILASENEGIIQIKANQPTLLSACEQIANAYNPTSANTSSTKCHGRFEKRNCYLFTNTAILKRYIPKTWDGICCIVMIKRERSVKNTKTKKYQKSIEISYYGSTKILTAKEFNKTIRDYWGIENSLNYVRDNALGEDKSRIRSGAMKMVILRSFALNILRVNGVENIQNARYENSLKAKRLLHYKAFL